MMRRPVRWKNRQKAVQFIVERMKEGMTFEQAFREMKRVARKEGFVQRNGHFELMTVRTYALLKKSCMEQYKAI